MAWQVGKCSIIVCKVRVPVLISWTGSWSWAGLWARPGAGPGGGSFGRWLRASLGRWLLLWRVGTRSAPGPGLRLSIPFTIFFWRSRPGPGSGPGLLRLLLGSAVRAWTPVRLGFGFALWPGLPAFGSGTGAVFASWPGFRSFKERDSLFSMACSVLPEAVNICQVGSSCTGSVNSGALTGNGFWRHSGICCGCSDFSDFCF